MNHFILIVMWVFFISNLMVNLKWIDFIFRETQLQMISIDYSLVELNQLVGELMKILSIKIKEFLFLMNIFYLIRVSEREFCSRQQIFYIILGIVWTSILLIVIIIPAVIGSITRNGRWFRNKHKYEQFFSLNLILFFHFVQSDQKEYDSIKDIECQLFFIFTKNWFEKKTCWIIILS